jgi:hypothetical protein
MRSLLLVDEVLEKMLHVNVESLIPSAASRNALRGTAGTRK